MVKLVLQVLTGVLVVSLLNTTFTSNVGAGLHSPASAKLLSFKRVGAELHFDVLSNGCTSEADFEVHYNDGHGDTRFPSSRNVIEQADAVFIRLVRLNEDSCRRRPMRYSLILYSGDDIAERQVQLVNSFITMPRLTRNSE